MRFLGLNFLNCNYIYSVLLYSHTVFVSYSVILFMSNCQFNLAILLMLDFQYEKIHIISFEHLEYQVNLGQQKYVYPL